MPPPTRSARFGRARGCCVSAAGDPGPSARHLWQVRACCSYGVATRGRAQTWYWGVARRLIVRDCPSASVAVCWRPRAPPICDLNHTSSGIRRRPQAARSWRHAETLSSRRNRVSTRACQKPAQTGMAIAAVQSWHGAVHADCGSGRTGGTRMRCVKRLLGQRTGSHGCPSACDVGGN
jgi:hypothetical protein